MSFINREAADHSGERITFSFGQNWSKFLSLVNDERISSACRSIVEFTGLENLKGRTFLDVGCGSGLFSLAACRMGADRIISIDIDPYSIECVRQLYLREGSPACWMMVRASALALPLPEYGFDFVYSWGVLHHTGAMWQAIHHVAGLVSVGGLFYLAIYQEERYSRRWLEVKRFYNRQNGFVKQIMILGYAGFFIIATLRHGKNPWGIIRERARTARGMSWLRDIEDWLGGLPYEYTRPQALIEFLRDRRFECLRSPDIDSMEYLFARV